MAKADIYKSFLKIGFLSVGGLSTGLALLEKEFVEKGKYITREEFCQGLGLSQTAPGAIMVNLAYFIGHRLGGWKGGIAALALVNLPSFVMVLFLSFLYFHYAHLPGASAILKGVGPAAVALLLALVFKLSRTSLRTPWAAVVMFIAFFFIFGLKIHAVLCVLGAGFIGILGYWRSMRHA